MWKMMAVFGVPALVGVPCAMSWVRPDLTGWLGSVGWCAGLLGVWAFRVPSRPVWTFAAWVVSGVVALCLAMAFWVGVLSWRGTPVEAVVAEVHASATGATTYTLAHDGVSLPGRLTSWPDGDAAPGDLITVVHDPAGLVDPRLPQEVADAKVAAPILLPTVLAILAALCFAATHRVDRR